MQIIKINNMRFHAHIGVYAEEKKLGQNIEIDLKVTVDLPVLQHTDDLEHTISYGRLYRMVNQIVATSRVDLVESLGYQIIQELKTTYGSLIEQIEVNIRKLATPIDGIFDNVEITLVE